MSRESEAGWDGGVEYVLLVVGVGVESEWEVGSGGICGAKDGDMSLGGWLVRRNC